jgi:GGDEF domain-containing protein
MDMPMSDGRTIRSQCAVLPGGGRMLTFSDITDLVGLAKLYERLAVTDGLTGLFNRRHFLARAEARVAALPTLPAAADIADARYRSFQVDQRSVRPSLRR